MKCSLNFNSRCDIGCRGVSFIELMAVVAILGIALTVSVPQVAKLFSVNQERTAAWDLLRDLRFCQQQALARKEIWGVSIDGTAGTYYLFRGDSSQHLEARRLPEGVLVSYIKFGTQKSSKQVVSFNGNGNPVQGGGSVTLSSTQAEKEFRLTVSIYPAKVTLAE